MEYYSVKSFLEKQEVALSMVRTAEEARFYLAPTDELRGISETLLIYSDLQDCEPQ